MKKTLVLAFMVLLIFTLGTLTVFASETGSDRSCVVTYNDVEYYSLQEAIDAATPNSKDGPQYLIFQSDIVLTETVKISDQAKNYAIVFNLNGHSITSSANPVIQNDGYMGLVDDSGKESSIVSSVDGGTVINSTFAFAAIALNEATAVGNGTGYALVSTGTQCTVMGGTYLGKVEISINNSMPFFTQATAGVFSEDPSAFMSGNCTYYIDDNGNYSVDRIVTLNSIFTHKGYSLRNDGTAVTAGLGINHEYLELYEKQNGVNIDFGGVFGIDSVNDNTVHYSFTSLTPTDIYNVIITDISSENYEIPLILSFYFTVDGDKQYITNGGFTDASGVTSVTYASVAEGN